MNQDEAAWALYQISAWAKKGRGRWPDPSRKLINAGAWLGYLAVSDIPRERSLHLVLAVQHYFELVDCVLSTYEDDNRTTPAERDVCKSLRMIRHVLTTDVHRFYGRRKF